VNHQERKELMEYAMAAGDGIVERSRQREIKDRWPKGSGAPSGYVDWHEWAEAQQLHGLHSTKCSRCKKWHFPQEVEGHTCTPPKSPHRQGGE
jgi:hypothetical protein